MRRDTLLFRLAAIAALAGHSAPLTLPARAQSAPDEGNPPARVGALTQARGTVSLHAAGADAWSPAAVNYPITPGEGVWTEPGAEARIGISATDLVMAGATEIEVSALDERALVATLPEGEAYVRVRGLAEGESYTIVTPRGGVTISAPGRYAVLAGDTETPTRITVLEGAATLGDGPAGSVAAGQAAEITGTEAPFQVQLGPVSRDPFIDHVLAEERPRPARVPPPPLVAAMPGGAELAEYGAWSQSPQYGEVWYPEVRPGWVPYREGHWAYVAPWGWTWIDADPWGFAPFHYGRWVEIGGRWAWTPGRREPVAEAPPYPVYAPALVTFFGVGAAVGAAALLGGGSVGWVPLGPGEPYRPWFHAGPRYERDVNIRNVTNVTQITNVTNTSSVTINQLHNAAGATVVPAAAMATSRSLAGEARPATPQVLAAARPVLGRPPVPPTTATAGITPAVARAVQAVPAPAGVAPRPAAPGPAIRAQAPAGTLAAGQHAAPPLVRHGGPANAQAPRPPAEAATAAVAHPAATPALRSPGAKPPAPTAQAGAALAAQGPAFPTPAQTPAHGAAATAHAASAPPPTIPAAHPAPHATSPVSPAAVTAPRVAHPQVPVAAHPATAAVHPPAPPVIHQAPPAPIAHPQVAAVAVPHPPAAAPAFHPAPPAPVQAAHPVPTSVHAEPPRAAPPPPAPHPAPPAPAPHPAPHQEKRPGQP